MSDKVQEAIEEREKARAKTRKPKKSADTKKSDGKEA